MSPKPRRLPTRTAAAAPVYQLKITLAEVEPPVWRRIRVRGDLLAWAGGRFDPEAFDLAAVNRRLRRLK